MQTHSDFSDGDYAVKDVIKLAKKNGLRAISITDHNTWYGLKLKERLARAANILNVQGVEISTKIFDTEVHILGYSLNLDEHILKLGLTETVNGYNQRAKMMLEKLAATKIINLKISAIKKSKNSLLPMTKYDLAKTIAKRLKITPKQALAYFNSGGVAQVPYGDWAMLPSAAVKLIHQANGYASLAHPGETLEKLVKRFGQTIGEKKFKLLISELSKSKIDAIEVYSPKNNLEMRNRCKELAVKHHWLITGGSDWHGEHHHPEIAMGDGGLNEHNFKTFIKTIKKNRRP